MNGLPPCGIDCCKGAISIIKIYLGNDVIGEALVEKQGLYYYFACRCDLTGEVIYKLLAVCDENEVDLGICVPYNGGFGLKTRCPIKHLGTGLIQIRAVPRHSAVGKEFIPLRPEEPFSYLSRLGNAYLDTRNGVTGIVIRPDSESEAQDLQDSGQSR